MCEVKEMESKLENVTSEEEYNNIMKGSDFEERAEQYASYMQATYSDESSEESLELKDRMKPLLLKCFSQEEIDNMKN